MNEVWQQTFASEFGGNPPSQLIQFLGNSELINAAPLRFHFADKPFILEIQYFSAPNDVSNYDLVSKCYRFAVTSDGYDLLVDLKNSDLPILQDEAGSRDNIGLIVRDLLNATVAPIS